jgi:hypothetical protein
VHTARHAVAPTRAPVIASAAAAMEALLVGSEAQRASLSLLLPLEGAAVAEFARSALASLRPGGDDGVSKAHGSAAKRLGVAPGDVRDACAALGALLLAAARAALPPPALAQRAAALGFAHADAVDALAAVYEGALPELRADLAAAPPPMGRAFAALHWRLDVRVRVMRVMAGGRCGAMHARRAGARVRSRCGHVAGRALTRARVACVCVCVCVRSPLLSRPAPPQLASRAAQAEAAPSYLLQLLSTPPCGGAPEVTWLESDHAALRELSAAVDAALRAADGAHARRLRRYLK